MVEDSKGNLSATMVEIELRSPINLAERVQGERRGCALSHGSGGCFYRRGEAMLHVRTYAHECGQLGLGVHWQG